MNRPDHQAFTIRHRAGIVALVDRMRRERTLATVEFGDGHAIVSSVLEVRRDSGALVFDIARDADQNARLFGADRLGFVTELDHVHVAFDTGAAVLVSLPDGPAACVELPSAVVRLQRRECFRAALPVQPPVRCTVLDEDGNAMPAHAIDLSAEGAALVVEGPLGAASTPGRGHELVMTLPDVGRIETDATLCSMMPVRGANDAASSATRLGFRFEALPSKKANEIQRYVQRIEVEQLRVLRRRG